MPAKPFEERRTAYAGIHVLNAQIKEVMDGRNKSGHDGKRWAPPDDV
jgi:hypothetical protein